MSISREQWAKMTVAEREAYKAARLAKAKEAVKTGVFPKGLQLRIGSGDKPAIVGIATVSGATDKGSLSYTLARGTTFQVLGPNGTMYQGRVNTPCSISLLSPTAQAAQDNADMDVGEVW